MIVPSYLSVPGCGRNNNDYYRQRVPGANNNEPKVIISYNACNSSQGDVYLPLVPVKISNRSVLYALLDNGSTNTLISQQLTSELGTKGNTVSCKMNTVGSSTTVSSELVTLASVDNNYTTSIKNA